MFPHDPIDFKQDVWSKAYMHTMCETVQAEGVGSPCIQEMRKSTLNLFDPKLFLVPAAYWCYFIQCANACFTPDLSLGLYGANADAVWLACIA